MTTPTAAEIDELCRQLQNAGWDKQAAVLNDYAALLRAAEGDEPSRAFVSVASDEDFVCTEYADWQRAGRLLALAENEQLKAQLAEFVASFDAAIFEGLLNKLSELHPHETGSIGDLVTRRLLYTYEKYLADAAEAK